MENTELVEAHQSKQNKTRDDKCLCSLVLPLFKGICIHLYLLCTGTETPGKSQAPYLLVLAILDLQFTM